MFCVLETGGKQYKVSNGECFNVEKLDANVNDIIDLKVLMLADGENIETGNPYLTKVAKCEVVKQGKVLVDFYATWCGPCRMLSPVLDEVSEDLPEVTILKVNVDEYPELSARFGVTAIPTLIEFNKEKQVNLFRGYLSKEDLEIALTK